jgi:hypothetical protein
MIELIEDLLLVFSAYAYASSLRHRSIRSCFRSRAALQVEILAIRHQFTVLKRSQRGQLHLNFADRLFWVALSRI